MIMGRVKIITSDKYDTARIILSNIANLNQINGNELIGEIYRKEL